MYLAATFAATLAMTFLGTDDPPQREIPLVGTAGSLCVLIDHSNVHAELGLTPEQAKACIALADQTRDRLFATYRAMNRKELPASSQTRDVHQVEASFTKETSQAIAAILTPAQVGRLAQISLQSGTVGTFLEPPVRDALKLDEAQITAFHEIQDEARRTIQRDVRTGVDPHEVRKKALAFRQDGRTKALALLSAEQKAAWNVLVGKPFFLGNESPKDIEIEKK